MIKSNFPRPERHTVETARYFDKQVGSEKKNLHTRQTASFRKQAICAFGCLVLLGLAFLLDEKVAGNISLSPDSSLRSAASLLSKSGQGWVIAAGGSVLSLLLLSVRYFKYSRAVLLIVFTSLATGATATILRSLIGRTRPNSKELQGFYGIWHHGHWIFGRAEFGSFPSGHVATVMGLTMAAWLIDRRLGVAAAIYALLVSWSRIALGCHHFSDTVAAAIVAIYAAPVFLSGSSSWLGRKRLLLT